MALKIAINGFGRIGRCVARIAATRDDAEKIGFAALAVDALPSCLSMIRQVWI